MIDLLPKELIIEIFHLLPRQSLLSLTETCKLFNEIISENYHLSENFELYFVPENKILKWTGCRKYSRVYLEGTAASFYRDIFTDISENLREIHIVCLSMNGSILKDIFLTCINLKLVLIKDNRISYKNEDFEEPLPQLNLQILNYRNFTLQPTEVFKILTKCQVRDLKIVGFSSSCTALKTFIKNQRNMLSIAIHDADQNSSIFSTEMLDSVDFKLTKLVLDKYSNDCQGLEKFLQNHRLSLQHVELNEVKQDVLNMLKTFPYLRKLKIFEMFFKANLKTEMITVEKLTIGYDVTGCWAINFPKLYDLKVTWIRLKRDLIQIEELKMLQKLDIEYCCIPELSIPTVKHLKLSEVGFSAERPFRLDNNAIEELILDHCTHAEWLIEYLAWHASKLKLLRIKNMELSDECKKIVERCSKTVLVQIYE